MRLFRIKLRTVRSRRGWRSNPSGKCSQERPTRTTVTGTKRRAAHPSGCARCGAGAGCSVIKYQSLFGVGEGAPSRPSPPRTSFGFQVSRFGIWDSGFGIRETGFGIRVEDFGLKVVVDIVQVRQGGTQGSIFRTQGLRSRGALGGLRPFH